MHSQMLRCLETHSCRRARGLQNCLTPRDFETDLEMNRSPPVRAEARRGRNGSQWGGARDRGIGHPCSAKGIYSTARGGGSHNPSANTSELAALRVTSSSKPATGGSLSGEEKRFDVVAVVRHGEFKRVSFLVSPSMLQRAIADCDYLSHTPCVSRFAHSRKFDSFGWHNGFLTGWGRSRRRRTAGKSCRSP